MRSLDLPELSTIIFKSDGRYCGSLLLDGPGFLVHTATVGARFLVYLISAALGPYSAATAKPLVVQTSVYSRVAPDYQRKTEEIEAPRYYISVRAYEFRAAVEKREKKLLWITRISVSARGTDFNESLRPMIARAAPYFGQPTKRLVREFKGTVEFGDSSVVEVNAHLPMPEGKDRTETRKASK